MNEKRLSFTPYWTYYCLTCHFKLFNGLEHIAISSSRFLITLANNPKICPLKFCLLSLAQVPMFDVCLINVHKLLNFLQAFMTKNIWHRLLTPNIIVASSVIVLIDHSCLLVTNSTQQKTKRTSNIRSCET